MHTNVISTYVIYTVAQNGISVLIHKDGAEFYKT